VSVTVSVTVTVTVTVTVESPAGRFVEADRMNAGCRTRVPERETASPRAGSRESPSGKPPKPGSAEGGKPRGRRTNPGMRLRRRRTDQL